MTQSSLFHDEPVDLLTFEKQAHRHGFKLIAGVDEAGRGPLAGPVVAAAVILPQNLLIKNVNDSKQLTPAMREKLFDTIMNQALSVGIGMGNEQLIDSVNILQATRYAMLEAVTRLNPQPDFILIDGISKIESHITQKTVKKGDSLSISIAAASIIAKVTRDRMMRDLDKLHPGYGFASHKGYGCASHLAAIRQLGPCPIHRLTFRGVKEYVQCPSS